MKLSAIYRTLTKPLITLPKKLLEKQFKTKLNSFQPTTIKSIGIFERGMLETEKSVNGIISVFSRFFV